MINAVMYVRFSSDNQRDESIDGQIRAIKEYANKNGYNIVGIYADRAKTATTDKRPEFQRMLEDSSKGHFSVVIVHKLDRFARDKYDSAIYKRKLKINGVRVISVLESLDDSPESVILESVLEGMAEYYSKNLAREVMKGMKENAYQCKHTGGTPPLGYDVDPDTKNYVINEYEAQAIRLIFSKYLEGYGYKKIIALLNEQGYKTKKGQPFGKNSINNLLKNEKYCGIYVFNKVVGKDARGKRSNQRKPDEELIIIPGGMPAIVSEEEFMKVQEKMKQNQRKSATYRAIECYLLEGIIFCGECGHAMVGNRRFSGRNKKKYVTYRCGNRDRTKSCSNKEIRREYIEKYVIEQLHKNIFCDEAIPILVQELTQCIAESDSQSKQDLSVLNKELLKIEKEIQNIVDAVSKGFTHPSFMKKIEELEDTKNKLELRINKIEANAKKVKISEEILQKLFATFKTYVAERNIPEIKKFIKDFVERIDIHLEHVDVIFKIGVVGMYGGGGGIRTPVRKRRYISISERSHSFRFRSRIRGVTR